MAWYYVVSYTFVYAFGFPGSIVLYLYWNRNKLQLPSTRSRVGFLYESYVPGAELWEIYELIRKILLTGIIVYFAVPIYKIILASFVCLVSLGVLSYYQPHKSRGIFWVAEMSYFVTSIKYMTASFLLYRENTVSVSTDGSLYGQGPETILLGTDFAFFLCSIVGTLYAVYILNVRIRELKAQGRKKLHATKKKIKSSFKLHKKKLTTVTPATRKENVAVLKNIRKEYGAQSEEYKNALTTLDK